jgi:hypothetical protein
MALFEARRPRIDSVGSDIPISPGIAIPRTKHEQTVQDLHTFPNSSERAQRAGLRRQQIGVLTMAIQAEPRQLFSSLRLTGPEFDVDQGQSSFEVVRI